MIPLGKVKNIPLLGLLTFILMIFVPGFAEPNFTSCSGRDNYTPNSSFEKSLNSLLNLLSLKAPKHGYYKFTLGSGGDQVYGQALCRGDVTRKSCQDCVANASREVIKQCPLDREAISWYEKCQVQYSFSPDFSDTYAAKFPDSNDQENWVVVHRDQYKAQLMQLMNNLSKETYGSKSMFATRKTKFEGTTIYALSQCLSDIKESSCETCLYKALEELYGCCGYRQGGTVFSRSCNVRFSVNKFYRETTNGK